ncbi:uncharacterized protein SPAPADRAFT_58781 [Spathaspora passalidarum NRRL Y-27907]|uniref:intramembrane prenyl-peptidase Rce1 n=1 Tax=Spathaspora passalidarum (strain NRRL Y-27907 / 11-Y1) TaxID=619300 RepID=G3AE19_SPAPN|nr:uncharacterized protein SPAPADRAFT_58781 [Spathaspora passalidarum NRRL Y-27907]EGW35553.1 hypothetical protein SPAPADRAFT_58781 [Spathaspora passalidarum NRRL Y-27907]
MLLLTLAIAFSYFVVIYINQPKHLPSDRNDLRVIKFRFYRITQLCLFLLVVVPYLVPGNYTDNLRSLGLFPGYSNTHSVLTDLSHIVRTIVFLITIYCSSVYQYIIGDIVFIDSEAHVMHHIRDYGFAPVTEEFIYRGIISLVVHDTHAKYTPFLFGVAHLHHAFHLYRQGYPVGQVVTTSVFQLGYTSIFGYVANMIYSTSSNLWCVIVLHAGCNLFGVPSVNVHGTRLQRGVYHLLILVGIAGAYIELTKWWWH